MSISQLLWIAPPREYYYATSEGTKFFDWCSVLHSEYSFLCRTSNNSGNSINSIYAIYQALYLAIYLSTYLSDALLSLGSSMSDVTRSGRGTQPKQVTSTKSVNMAVSLLRLCLRATELVHLSLSTIVVRIARRVLANHEGV